MAIQILINGTDTNGQKTSDRKAPNPIIYTVAPQGTVDPRHIGKNQYALKTISSVDASTIGAKKLYDGRAPSISSNTVEIDMSMPHSTILFTQFTTLQK